MKDVNSRDRKGKSLVVSYGRWGGFYFHHGENAIRLCLGWIAITIIPADIDDLFERLLLRNVRGDERCFLEESQNRWKAWKRGEKVDGRR